MIKNEFIELVTGLGNAEVYFAIPGNGANIGKFWDFVGLAWVTPITADCKVFATEYNSDGTVSVYRADVTLPASGGPFIIYCYLESTGKLQGQDFTAVDEIEADVATVAGYVDTEIQAIVDALENATYGLSALKTLIDAIDTSTELAARFTEIKGAGWTTQTLKALGDLLDALPTAASIAASTSALILGSTVAKGVIQSRVVVKSNVAQTVSRGDVKTFTFNLGSEWNLTGKKLYLCVKKRYTDPNSSAIINRECTITSAANGIATFTTTAAETDIVGDFKAELEVRNTDETSPESARRFPFIIEQDGRQ